MILVVTIDSIFKGSTTICNKLKNRNKVLKMLAGDDGMETLLTPFKATDRSVVSYDSSADMKTIGYLHTTIFL